MEWHWVYIWGIAVWINYAFWIVKSLFDGPVLASTGRDSRDGNTVGDDRKSSKTSKRKFKRIRISSLNTA